MNFGQEFNTPQLHQFVKKLFKKSFIFAIIIIVIALWQSGKALDSDSRMHGFESYQGNHYAEIAQLVEQLNRNQ